MECVPYHQLPGLKHVYLEDSYVLNIQISPSSVEFSLLVVLTERHPLYTPPQPDERYCYRDGLLRFPKVGRLAWSERLMIKPATDATGEVDYGNIDEFYLTDGHYYLSGDWGRLEIESSPPSLKIQSAAPATL